MKTKTINYPRTETMDMNDCIKIISALVISTAVYAVILWALPEPALIWIGAAIACACVWMIVRGVTSAEYHHGVRTVKLD